MPESLRWCNDHTRLAVVSREKSHSNCNTASTNFRCSEIWLQFFRNLNRTICLLIAFDERGKQSRQRQTGAVQRVAESILTFCIFEPQVHPARLKIFKV